MGSGRWSRLRIRVSPNRVFLAMGNTSTLETAVLRDVLTSIAALLPAAWGLDQRVEALVEERRLDAVVDLTAPTGDRLTLAVEIKRSGSVPTPLLLGFLRDLEKGTGLPALFASDYVGPSLRAALTQSGINFADGTGWVHIVADEPLVLLTGQGAERSPRVRGGSAVTRFNGVAASRAFRSLVNAELPIGVRSLASVAEVSPGSASKLLVTLASEGIVDRDERGAVVTVRPRALIRRWTRDYSFGKSNPSVAYYLAPRGLDRTMARLADTGGATLTGSAAARRSLPSAVTSVVPLRILALYAAHPAELAAELGLVEADARNANVVIAAPQDDRVLAKATDRGVAVAPLALVIADLLTLPGRSDAEADQLMDALAATDSAWEE